MYFSAVSKELDVTLNKFNVESRINEYRKNIWQTLLQVYGGLRGKKVHNCL